MTLLFDQLLEFLERDLEEFLPPVGFINPINGELLVKFPFKFRGIVCLDDCVNIKFKWNAGIP